jgi:hypothetical protein
MQTSLIHWLTPVYDYNNRRRPDQASSARECGSCTSCCQGWLKATIQGHAIHPGHACHHVVADGCSIYDSRPISPCRSFSCAWKIMPHLFPPSFRPDVAGFILKATSWNEFSVFILVSAGKDPQVEHLNWMTTLCHSTGLPFFYEANGETIGYGPNKFVSQLSDYQAKNKPLW